MATTKTRTPAGLKTPGKRLWRAITSAYELEPHHLEVLETAARALDRAEDCRRSVEADGAVVKDRFDQPKAHPLLVAERDARNLMLRSLRDLGLDFEIPGRS